MRALYLAILFGLVFSLVPARALVAADGSAKRRPPKSLGVADKRLESFEDRLRRGEWQAVHAAAHEMVIELVTAGSEDGRLASALRALALAEAGIGRVDEAVWHWQVVQNLKPGLVLDPAAYGEAGALLARHKLRRPGEAPAGLGAVAAGTLGAGSTPPRKIAGDDPKIPSSLAASGAPRWARLQVVIDTQGRALEPVVLAGRSEAFQWAALEAVRTWRFEPARREGQPVAVLLDIDLPPRAGTPLAEMLPLSGEAGSIHALLLKQEWREARTRASALVRKVADEGPNDRRQMAAPVALLALADAGSEGSSSACYWHAAQSLYGDLYHASLAAYGTAGVRLEESNPWMRNEEVFRVGPVPQGTVSRPEKISGAQPYYPAKDRAALVEGVIVSELLVEKDGRITQPRVLQSLSPGLDLQALVTFCDWRFKPATLDGKPVRVYYMLTTSFEVR